MILLFLSSGVCFLFQEDVNISPPSPVRMGCEDGGGVRSVSLPVPSPPDSFEAVKGRELALQNVR